MNDNKSWDSLGREIRDAVQKALQEGDFSKIGDVAVDTVHGTIRNVENLVGQAINNNQNMSRRPNQTYTEYMAQVTKQRKDALREEKNRKTIQRNQSLTALKAHFHPIGKYSSVLYKVFGGIGTGVMGILSLVFLGVSFSTGKYFTVVFVLLLALLAFIGMIRVGCSQKKRLDRAGKYADLTGNNHYINIEDLAMHLGKSTKMVVKDLKRMIERGFFPEGHLDAQETCFMLDDRIYREYLSIEKQRKIQEREKIEEKSQKEKRNLTGQFTANQNSELEQIITEGQEYIRKLRNMNDNIPGEEISAKLFRLENLLKEIFDRLKEAPEQTAQMHKFMTYYLPTTIKLVAAYEEFDAASVQGDDIIEAKTEIEKTLDSINEAFEELLNRLLRSAVYDVTTDAQVLKTMLANEGLTKESEFERIRR